MLPSRLLSLSGRMAALALLTTSCADDPPDLVRQTIGPAGGLVSSHDDVLTLVFQPGALTRDQEIVIFPSDEPPLIFGPAYRVQPDLELMIDVEVSYRRALPSNTSSVAVSAIKLDDYTNEEGYWVGLPRLSIHPESGLLSALDSELSLYYGMLERGGGSGTTTTNGSDDNEGSGATGGGTDPSDTDPTDTDPTDPTDTDPTDPTAGGCGDGSADAGELCFATMDFTMSGGPIDVALGDFDMDGRLDVATANADGSYSVRLGDGTGGFGSEENIMAGNGPTSIVSGNLDQVMGDDLVITLSGTNQMLLLQSQGNGSFGPNLIGLAGTAPSEVILADVNQDGGPDIVIANSGSATVSYFPFPGSLGTEAPYATNPVMAPVGLSWGHYNQNDDPANEDVIAFGGNTYSVLPGTGTGLSDAPLSGTVGTDLRRAVGGDLGGSSAGDVAVADFAEGGVHVMLGDGSALGFASIDFLATGAGAVDVIAVDLNSDGDLDLVVANNGADTATLLEKTGGSSWGNASDFIVGGGPSGIATADLNDDGVPDVVVSNQRGNSITVLVSDP